MKKVMSSLNRDLDLSLLWLVSASDVPSSKSGLGERLEARRLIYFTSCPLRARLA
jgi:hypothetical protein